MQYPNSLKVLDQDVSCAPSTPLTDLARSLIEGGKRLDILKFNRLGTPLRPEDVMRDKNNPPYITDPKIIGMDWADDEENPLQPGEQWNEGRRATNTGLRYIFNEQGRPVNPYVNTGLAGRGLLGQFGPNHAVDNGILVVQPDDTGMPVLFALGILRKPENNAPALAGGFAKYSRGVRGEYILDADTIIDSKLEEFFEEMVSGSISLLPEYQDQLEPRIEAKLQSIQSRRGNAGFSEAHLSEIREQVETALKLQQVRDKDPGFLERLRGYITNGRECFAGPVLAAARNTNNAWIETRLSWFALDDDIWKNIKGDNPAFDYQFSPGDDAGAVVYHKLDGDLIQKAFDSHGPMFAFMTASYLLDRQRQNMEIPPSIIEQAKTMALALV